MATILAYELDDPAMRIVRIALVVLAVLAGATACKRSDSEDKSAPTGSVTVAATAAGSPAPEAHPARVLDRNVVISARAALAWGTTPGMLTKAWVAPGCSVSRTDVPASRRRSA